MSSGNEESFVVIPHHAEEFNSVPEAEEADEYTRPVANMYPDLDGVNNSATPTGLSHLETIRLGSLPASLQQSSEAVEDAQLANGSKLLENNLAVGSQIVIDSINKRVSESSDEEMVAVNDHQQ